MKNIVGYFQNNMKTFVTQSKIDKKLCIHCKHCESVGLFPPRLFCGLYRSKADDSPLYSVQMVRNNPFKCGGRKWEISPNIQTCETEEEAERLQHEESVASYMSRARRIVATGERCYMTCGALDEAIKRVRRELANTR